MKKDIHPRYDDTLYECGCGNKFTVRSTMGKQIAIEICNNCHPAYTGKAKVVDTEGRIDRFKKKYAKGTA